MSLDPQDAQQSFDEIEAELRQKLRTQRQADAEEVREKYQRDPEPGTPNPTYEIPDQLDPWRAGDAAERLILEHLAAAQTWLRKEGQQLALGQLPDEKAERRQEQRLRSAESSVRAWLGFWLRHYASRRRVEEQTRWAPTQPGDAPLPLWIADPVRRALLHVDEDAPAAAIEKRLAYAEVAKPRHRSAKASAADDARSAPARSDGGSKSRSKRGRRKRKAAAVG